jgi:hypothetical protein
VTTSAVSRTVGFAQSFEFVAEVTTEVSGGFVTVREFGHTEWGALARAESSAASKMHARQRRTGFYEGGFEYRTPCFSASFKFGFQPTTKEA